MTRMSHGGAYGGKGRELNIRAAMNFTAACDRCMSGAVAWVGRPVLIVAVAVTARRLEP
jgi:hypothetical protein